MPLQGIDGDPLAPKSAPVVLAGMLARLIATWFGCGYSKVAPGTVGTFGALPLCWAAYQLGPLAYWAVALLVTVLGVWASGAYARAAGEEDPQSVVVDEVSGTMIAVGFALPGGLLGIGLAVGLFRFFDIVKPGPIDDAQRLPRGYGIMADDVLSGLSAGLVIAVVKIWLPL